jgi:hypothetical protein
MQSSGLSLPGRRLRERANHIRIESYRSARCSGIRFSFQCSTASAVSITGLLAMRRISTRLSTASINYRA